MYYPCNLQVGLYFSSTIHQRVLRQYLKSEARWSKGLDGWQLELAYGDEVPGFDRILRGAGEFAQEPMGSWLNEGACCMWQSSGALAEGS